MKKYILFILLLLLPLIILMSACGSDSNGDNTTNPLGENDNNQNVNETGEIAAKSSGPEFVSDSLPDDLNFNGADVNLFIQGDTWKQEEFVAEEDIGDVVNDAVFKRNIAVEDRLNINLNVISGPGWENWNTMSSQIKKSIMAGDQSYDLIAGWSARAPSLALEDLFMNLLELPHIELSKPWWNQSIISEMTLGGKLNFLCGDMTLSMISNCSVIYFNKTVQQDFALPDFYQTVLDGKWTIDYMYSLTKDVGKDLNGDGIMDDKDLYGILLEPLNVSDGFMQSSNIKMISLDNAGMPQLNVEHEKLSGLVDKVYKLYYENTGAYVMPNQSEFPVLFKNNQALLMPERLSGAIGLRDMQSDYGVIPYPKYDETQEKYYSRIWDALSLMCVPMNCEKTELIGAFMEAMSSESYRTVTPAYFEIALKDKYTRDDVSSQMLDIVRENAYLNFASIYNESIGSPWHCMRALMQAKNNNFASWFEKNEPAIEKGLTKVIDSLEK